MTVNIDTSSKDWFNEYYHFWTEIGKIVKKHHFVLRYDQDLTQSYHAIYHSRWSFITGICVVDGSHNSDILTLSKVKEKYLSRLKCLAEDLITEMGFKEVKIKVE